MATKYLVCVLGPTASGKTSLAIQIAQHFNTHILSADSRQLYKGLDIGTAKATPEERAQAPHHFIDTLLNITEEYNAGQFERDSLVLLNELYQTHDVVVLAGGTGLYVQALLQGLDEFPAIPDEVRQQVRDDFDTKGLAWLQQEVLRLDPEFYGIVDKQNPSRLTRALEVCRASGKPYSSFRSGKAKLRGFSPILIGLEWPKEALYGRIDTRVDIMLEQGLLEEAHQFLPHKNQQALQTVGYEELMHHFEGEYDLPEAIRLIKRNSRHYAKRQMTWLKRMEGITWFKTAEVGEVIPFINQQIG
jgi:tRNA dimethylallyltransferase